jgi:DNA-binding PadR family transcriptional regulator
MSLENGILGFLAIKPLSGYDIKKLFDMSTAYFWPADQAQIYRTLKKLLKEGLIEFKEQKKRETVDRKVYEITEKGLAENLKQIQQNTVSDFISRDLFLLQLFFSGALGNKERLEFLDTQLLNINELKQKLINEYNINYKHFLNDTGLTEDDPRLRSIDWTYRWELIKCEEYAKLLKRFKAEMKKNEND